MGILFRGRDRSGTDRPSRLNHPWRAEVLARVIVLDAMTDEAEPTATATAAVDGRGVRPHPPAPA